MRVAMACPIFALACCVPPPWRVTFQVSKQKRNCHVYKPIYTYMIYIYIIDNDETWV